MPTYSMKQVTGFLQVSDTTLRTSWGVEFADYLSPSANPPKGEERRYTEDDLATLYTVATMRQTGQDYETIKAMLDQGQRIDPPPADRAMLAAAGGDETAVMVSTFQTALASYEARIDKLEDKLEEAQTARLSAEIRAARAETELSTLRAVYEAEAGQGGQKSGFAAWWARRFGGRN